MTVLNGFFVVAEFAADGSLGAAAKSTPRKNSHDDSGVSYRGIAGRAWPKYEECLGRDTVDDNDDTPDHLPATALAPFQNFAQIKEYFHKVSAEFFARLIICCLDAPADMPAPSFAKDLLGYDYGWTDLVFPYSAVDQEIVRGKYEPLTRLRSRLNRNLLFDDLSFVDPYLVEREKLVVAGANLEGFSHMRVGPIAVFSVAL